MCSCTPTPSLGRPWGWGAPAYIPRSAVCGCPVHRSSGVAEQGSRLPCRVTWPHRPRPLFPACGVRSRLRRLSRDPRTEGVPGLPLCSVQQGGALKVPGQQCHLLGTAGPLPQRPRRPAVSQPCPPAAPASSQLPSVPHLVGLSPPVPLGSQSFPATPSELWQPWQGCRRPGGVTRA